MTYHPAHARHPAQAARMAELGQACLFCSGPDVWPVLHRTECWSAAVNAWPYAGAEHHLLLAPRVHVTDLLELDRSALCDMWDALAWVRDQFGLDHYTLGVRCGHCAATGATIEHVHVHVVVASPGGAGRFRMSGRS